LRPAAILSVIFLLPAGVRGDLRVPAPGRTIDLGRTSATIPPDGDPARPVHLLVKLVSPLGAAETAELRRAGLSVSTVLSQDAAVLYGSPRAAESSPLVAWYSGLAPEDKAPAALLAGRGAVGRVSVLGHPGSTVAELTGAASAAGLAVSGGRESRFGARIEVEAGADRGAVVRFLARDPVFAAFPAVSPRLANDRSIGTIQSGHPLGPTPIFDQGLFGEGETIGILDTGLDVDSCFFADPGKTFPVNSYLPRAGYGTTASGSHRKIAAYDFLRPCSAFAPPCDRWDDPMAYDNQGHGTHVAGNAAGDDLVHPLDHDPGDGMAPGARLVVQDAGFDGSGGECGELPGLGCAPAGLPAILEEAYAQGARIHSDSWYDDSAGSPPGIAGYSMSARDVDDFAFQHPDFLLLFAAGNMGESGASSVPSPGNGKNVVCVGSTRNSPTGSDDDLSDFSSIGPAADGRIKPDLVAPGVNVSASGDLSVSTDNCSTAPGAGTSFAAPTAAGAAALVREYFDRGFYPSGTADPASVFSPSAALLKAMLVSSARSLPGRRLGAPVAAAPSPQQGFGRIELSRVLAFADSPFRLLVADRVSAFSAGSEAATFPVTVRSAASPLRVTLVWTDPPGVPHVSDDPAPELVDDLDLSVEGPGFAARGNAPPAALPGDFDRLNNVEQVTVEAPVPGRYLVRVAPRFVAPGTRVGFAVVATGDIDFAESSRLGIDDSGAGLADGGPPYVSNCETRSASFRVVNTGTMPSPGGARVSIDSLDEGVEVSTRSPIAIPPVPPGGSLDVRFQLRAGFAGTPVECAGSVAFRVTLTSAAGDADAEIALPTAPGPAGCAGAGPLTCALPPVAPIRPPH